MRNNFQNTSSTLIASQDDDDSNPDKEVKSDTKWSTTTKHDHHDNKVVMSSLLSDFTHTNVATDRDEEVGGTTHAQGQGHVVRKGAS